MEMVEWVRKNELLVESKLDFLKQHGTKRSIADARSMKWLLTDIVDNHSHSHFVNKKNNVDLLRLLYRRSKGRRANLSILSTNLFSCGRVLKITSKI